MEDSIEVILQDHSRVLPTNRPHPVLSACTGVLLTGLYGVWSVFVIPGFRKVPWSLKVLEISFFSVFTCLLCSSFFLIFQISNSACLSEIKEEKQRQNLTCTVTIICLFWSLVLHASNKCGRRRKCKHQTQNVMKLLEGRRGRLADLGSGDGRLVFAASSAGFQCTGFEINSILVAYARSKAFWKEVPPSQATFVKKDFWKTDLSSYNNVTAFLAPGVMGVLGEKLLKELPDDARVIACRFPFPNWPHQSSAGSSLDESFAYDISTVRSHLRNAPNAIV